jgi:PPOX class probable F420-dependent enzyme
MSEEGREGEFSWLVEHEYINLITFRRDSSAVHTTVRFVALGDYVYIQTPRDAGKIKRIQATGRVLLVPSNHQGTPLGRSRLGLGRVVEGSQAEEAGQAMQAKYGEAHVEFLIEVTRTNQGWEIIEIRPWDE